MYTDHDDDRALSRLARDIDSSPPRIYRDDSPIGLGIVAALLIALATLCLLLAAGPARGDDLAPLFRAIGQVESGHDDDAVGDGGKSRGRLQIQWACWKDATDFDQTIGGEYKDVHDPVYAGKIMRAYMRRYEPRAYREADYESLSRLWNSGPAWAKKKHLTDGYWAKVKKEIDKVRRD